eukprot:CAMPEP_0202381302 /NCGR_PEP_ID=MMETSP1127-20130417/34877_1 /ASSEMBLY_ACC=CAM_ASM_000462 /TAXON_ID=3047 /ORGANISM="Dunaliella tertiolecta, Strain CCMP1320" /LENGTH=37 /DNA_ID= /DNA_START= /DNA_END= /DNA_ORIENTATION=
MTVEALFKRKVVGTNVVGCTVFSLGDDPVVGCMVLSL